MGVGFGELDLMVVVGVVEVDVVEDGPGGGVGLAVVDVAVEVEVVGAGVMVVVVGVAEGHDCQTWVIGRFTGSGSERGRVPGGTLWKVNFWPPATVMITVQPSAEAFGIAARPSTATTEPKLTAAIFSFRLLNTVA